MTQPATNAQVALQCAVALRASSNPGNTWKETVDLFALARRIQRWLDTGNSIPDRPGEL